MSGPQRSAKLQRVDDADDETDGAPSNATEQPDRVTESVFDDDQDIVKLLEQRLARGVYCGKVCGHRVCIDNLGFAFDESQLANELTQHLGGVQSIKFASIPVESFTIRAGYGCIEFDSLENAVRGMIKLESLYLDSPGSPIPRPILSHFPQRASPLWGTGDIPGYILDHGVSPHFSQPNTIEYDVALEWKQQRKWLSLSKKRLLDAYTKCVCKELIDYRRQADTSSLQAAFSMQLPTSKPRTVVCRGVSAELKKEQIRSAVEVADYCGNIRRLQCPVTGHGTGTVFVEISSPERATSFVEDMKRFLFIMGRAPRPVEADIVRLGPPLGFEGVFDRAVESVFDVKMSQLDPSQFSNSHVVDISSWKYSEKRKYSERIRKTLEGMVYMRTEWKLKSHENQQDLHERQKEWIGREMQKLEKLEAVVPQFFDENER